MYDFISSEHFLGPKHFLSYSQHLQCNNFNAVSSFLSTVKKPEVGNGRLFTGKDHINAGFQFPEWGTAETPSEPPVTHVIDKDNSWLYSLDPILLTIIVMSSLGVLLGAVCAGLLLYCTCSYGGLTSRSSTTLENYNFELYDGIKHKVKLNQQRCCSEAWGKQMGWYQVS